MTFDEAVTTVSEQPDLCLTGLALDRRGEWLAVYFLCSTSSTSSTQKRIQLTCERAQLFSTRCEVVEYDVDSAPAEAMLVEYTDHSAELRRRNAGEQRLRALFPELPEPEESGTDEFRGLAVQAAEASDYITVV